MDKFTKEKRSEIMSKIRGKNTAPEMKVRSLLHSLGYRFRLHRTDLPGKPDIVLPRYKTVVFVHGCFWHGHECQNNRKKPVDNATYWDHKILQNKARDIRVQQELRDRGWQVLIVWECELRSGLEIKAKLDSIKQGYEQNIS